MEKLFISKDGHLCAYNDVNIIVTGVYQISENKYRFKKRNILSI